MDGLLALHFLGGGLEFAGGVFGLEGGNVALGLPIDDDGGEEELVSAETLLGGLAVDQGISETADMAGRLPHLGVHDDGGLDPHDVVAAAHHVVPPAVADVLFQLDTEGAEVEEAVIAAVDFGRLEDEAPTFREGNNGLHEIGG